jgi:hypothetical protein
MKKTILLIVLISYSYYSLCQTEDKTDFNFGFEKISDKNRLPDNWFSWSTSAYSLNIDHAEKHSGSSSLLIQPVGPRIETSFGCAAYSIPAVYEGHNIELRAYMKLQKVENGQIGLMLRIDGVNGVLKFDNMLQKNIRGTSDWKLYSVKLALPKNAKTIYIGALLSGTGKLWVDDFQVLIDGKDINKLKPVTLQQYGADKNIESDGGSNNPTINVSHSKSSDLVTLEKVYLHSDRDSYYPGDDIWFKAYLIDAADRLLTNYSNNLHVELISPSLEIIDSRVVRINDGLGNGDFLIPDTLQSGQYQIRAYTNYMRNFGYDLFFNKTITIINPKDAVKAFSDSISSASDKLEISFFPESGSLVDSVPSIVAFKALNAYGQGCNVTGEVYSSSGTMVTTFKSTHKGMGTFSINPLHGLNYYAVVKNQDGDVIKRAIPKSFPTGIVLNISRNKMNEPAVTVRTNIETLALVRGDDLALTVSARNIFLKKAEFRMKSLADRFIFPVDDLPDGIVSLTLAGPDSIPLCERLVYIQNKEDIKVNIETDKPVYNQRDSVSLKISLSESTGINPEAFLSLSATKNISSESSSRFPSTISSWFLLESDIRGPVEEPSYYFDQSNPDRFKDLDLLLLTQGWRDFEWKYKNYFYSPENGFTVSGRIRRKFADVPLKNARINIAVFTGGNPLIGAVPVDTTGRFSLGGVDLTGDARVVVSATGEKEHLQGWVILDSLNQSPANVQGKMTLTQLLPEDDQSKKVDLPVRDNQIIRKEINSILQYAVTNNSIRKKYRLSDTIPLGEVKVIAKRSDKPESARAKSQRYLMALAPDIEYVVSPKSEVFNNVGQLLSFVFHMNAGNLSGLSYNNPLILLNGMNVGWEGIVSLPIEWIERVDGLRPGSAAAAAWGERGKGGVISVITRTDAPSDVKKYVYHSANIRLSGYKEPRIFYSPKHHTTLESDYKPDLRTTLFWEPNIKLETEKTFFLNYFNADNSSTVKIIVEGITSTGIPVTGKAEYEVK